MFKGSRYLFQGPSFWGPPAVGSFDPRGSFAIPFAHRFHGDDEKRGEADDTGIVDSPMDKSIAGRDGKSTLRVYNVKDVNPGFMKPLCSFSGGRELIF